MGAEEDDLSEIKPFRALRYQADRVGDVAKVVCPPYDVISPIQQAAYYEASPYNFIRILLGKEEPGDTSGQDKYVRARRTLDEWLREGILVQDERPAIYFYKQEFRVQGERRSRLGFIALMRIEESEQTRILPHEKTHEAAKEDRLRLWTSLEADASPIFVCFSDKAHRVEQVFNRDVVTQEALFDLVDDEGVRHRLWRVDDPDLIGAVREPVGRQPFFIADGHHRYEVAREYLRRKVSASSSEPPEDAPYRYVMTYFTNIDSRDLRIFPLHRVLKSFTVREEVLDRFFRIDRIKDADELVLLLAKAGRNEPSFGLYTREGGRLLRLRNRKLIDEIVCEGSDDFRRLDATILKAFVFDPAGVRTEEIVYSRDAREAVGMVDRGEAAACFLMNPVRISQLKTIALNGERMPPKTTYFYPKVLSGLTMFRLC